MSARWVWIGGVVAQVLACIAAVSIGMSRPLGYDFTAYWSAARRLGSGEILYPLAHRPDVFLGFGEYLYEPLVAVAFIPLAWLDLGAASVLWTLVEVALATWLALTLTRGMRTELRPWAIAAIVAFLPLVAEVTLGQLNLPTLALCIVAWRVRERAALAGVLLMLAVALKLLPLALLAFFLLEGRRRLVAWTAGSGLALIALSLPFLGAQWLDYLSLLATLATAPAAQAINIIPEAVLAGPLRVVLPMAAVAIAGYGGWRARSEDEQGWFALALAVAPFISPMVWYPYLVFTLPLLALLAARGRVLPAALLWLVLEVPSGRGPLPDLAFAATLALVAVGLVYSVAAGEGAGRSRHRSAVL